MQNKPIRSQISEMTIGKTTYTVHTHYKENTRETAEDKLLRYIKNRIAKERVF
jgi:hypothetical protein